LKTFLLLGLLTTHMISDNDIMNNRNYLVGVQHDKVVAATMVNSYNKRSYIGAYDYKYNDTFGAYIGFATGYEDLHIAGKDFHINGAAPIVAPYAKYKGVKVTLMGEVVNLSIEIPIGRKTQ